MNPTIPPEDDDAPLALSREDLYELAWSKPLRELAKDFGISDVALAKRCRRLGIPVPGRGYWARVDAGQRPYRPKLPSRERQNGDQSALIAGPAGVTPTEARAFRRDEEDAPSHHEAAAKDAAWLDERVAFENRPENEIQVPPISRKWHPGIKEIREALEREASEMRQSRKSHQQYEKWPAWRKRTESNSDGWKWTWAERRGQRLWDLHKPSPMRVSLDTYKRALSILNTLALAATARDFEIHWDKKIGRIIFTGHQVEIHLRITEEVEDRTRPSKSAFQAKKLEHYKTPTGILRINLQARLGTDRQFRDQDGLPLESQLNRVFVVLYRLIVNAWKTERARVERELRFQEQQRLRQEEARIAAERAQAAADEQARRRRLKVEANHWAQSRGIREYVAHIEAVAQEQQPPDESLAQWMDWARHVARDLDPTDGRISGDDE